MDHTAIKQQLSSALASDHRLWLEDKSDKSNKMLNQTKLIELAHNLDERIIDLLLRHDNLKRTFFKQIKDVYIFNDNAFRFFLEDSHVDDSYTQYANRIGLAAGKRFIADNSEVVLDFPFKDCVLAGGQSNEEGLDAYFDYDASVTKTQEKLGWQVARYNTKYAKRKEVFLNQVLAADAIDRLFDPKALRGWTRYNANGSHTIAKINRDEQGVMTENLIIKGNNLLALHSLAQQFYGQVKLIYIDPPYNTGNDSFGYNDRFSHSTWLSFIKNRLEIARTLLRDDGVIFLSCDDTEHAYLKVLLDEIFGRDNFISNVIWHKKRGKDNSAKYFSINHENILTYAKHKPSFVIGRLPLDDKTKKAYVNPDNDPRGRYRKLGIWSRQQGGSKYDYTTLAGRYYEERLWLVNKETMTRLDQDKRLVAINDNLYYKKFLSENEGSIPETIWLDASNNANAKDEIKALFGEALFKTPKPEPLLAKIIAISTEPNDIVLDFFLGSATTAAVAHKMGRQYIGIEQMDYIKDLSVTRLNKVIAGESGGISKEINWQGGGDFIYVELAECNAAAIAQIEACTSLDELMRLFDTLYEHYFLNVNLQIRDFRERVSQEANFQALSLIEQKQMFVTMLDANQLYVNYSEMSDSQYAIDPNDQALTRAFYGDK